MKFGTVITIIACTMAFTGTTYSAGFSIFEQGAAATGMAGAFTAQADDPSAIFYNPAGITQLEGTQVSIGGTIITTDSTLDDPYGGSWSAEKQTFFPPNLYVTHKMNESISMGLGLFACYGLGMKWNNNDDFIYRYLVDEVNLATYYINPVIAYQVNESISFAGGLYYVMSRVNYQASVDMDPISAALSAALGTQITLPDGGLELDGDTGSGEFGYSFGFHGKFDALRMGVTYRSEVECSYEGDAEFDVTPTGYGPQIDALVDGILPDTKGATKITMPASASFGLAYDFTDAFTMELDVNWMGWSSYESLDLDFEDPGVPDKSQIKDWDDVYSYRLGARYNLSELTDLYAGYLFDESPVPDETLDPILPDANRHSAQIGLGHKFGALKVDVSYMALFFEDRETTSHYLGLDGDYSSFSNLIGMQFTYQF